MAQAIPPRRSSSTRLPGQRNADRLRVVTPVNVREAGTPDEPLPLSLTQVSASGGFVESNLLLPLGSQLELELTLPGYDASVSVDARVVRVEDRGRHPGMGVVFDRMPPAARRHLRDVAALG